MCFTHIIAFVPHIGFVKITSIIPIRQMRKLRLGEIGYSGHTVSDGVTERLS